MLEYPLLCRLCGSKTENGLYIYCDEGKRRQVETKIRLYLHFQVLPSDSLPKKICASCFEELEGMHRFAINALKIQDQLLKMSKELPMSALDDCKTFMTSYVHEPVMVPDTVASLTNQEVTEMEVQVDPMVFLEDDQIDETPNESEVDNEFSGTDEGNKSQVLIENGDHEEVLEETNSKDLISKHSVNNVKISAQPEDKNGDIDSKQNIVSNASEGKEQTESTLIVEDNHQQESVDLKVPLTNEVTASKTGEPINNVSEQVDTEDASLQESLSSEPAIFRRSRKAITKNTKKSEPRPASTENIKCTTYTCPICKKVFMKRGPFKAHLEVHKTDHKYACEICLRVFKKENNLTQHKKSHTEQTTFPCTHCNRVYPTMSTLRSHLVSHSDERPHVCSICSKSFKRNQDLKFHLNQHNGLRPYQCPYCSKAFASSGNCFSHRRRAHMQEIERDRALRKSATAVS